MMLLSVSQRIFSILGFFPGIRLYSRPSGTWFRTSCCCVSLGLMLLKVPSYGQSNSFGTLEDSVYQLNNQLRFKESQTLLLPVLQSGAFSNDEKFQACILLSYTYKRVQDYQSNLLFLEKARQFASQTSRKEEYLAYVAAQEALAHFDIHNYGKSDSLMDMLEKTGFKHLDLENKAKLVMQQGYLRYLDKQYDRAEATYDRAIDWLREASPCDLPMIYVKKMQLYDAMRQPGPMRDAFAASRRYADSCGIIKYDIYAHEELLHIYQSHGDPAAVAISRRLDSLNKVYDQTANVAALHNQKETMLLAERDQKLQHEQDRRLYLTLGLVLAGLLVLALLAWGLLHYRRKHILEKEFRQMEQELADYLIQQEQDPPPAADPSVQSGTSPLYPADTNELSERQREVLDLLAAGLSNREIADRLFVSENTVKYHIRHIYQILGIKDRKDLLLNFRK